MRKYIIVIFLVIILIIGGIAFFIQESSYKNRIEKDFGFKTNGLKFEKKLEKEEWSPNGDGIKILILKYENLNGGIEDLDKLPIKEELPPNEIPKEFQSIVKGYYKCIIDEDDNRNFKILIVDPHSKEICVYYQIM